MVNRNNRPDIDHTLGHTKPKRSFDAYMWQALQTKAEFINQICPYCNGTATIQAGTSPNWLNNRIAKSKR